MEKYELLTASFDFGEYLGKDGSIVGIQNELAVVEEKLDLYTSKIDIFDMLLAVASGIISGYIDSKYIKAVKFEKVDFKTSFYKGSMNSMQLRLIEESKIHCAREHFKAISNENVVYDVVDSYQALMNKVLK